DAQDYELLAAPTIGHPLGTDNVGRDVLSRIIVGARISMVVGLSTVILAAVIGIVLGVAAGYYGGWMDMIVMRLIDILWAFPNFILAVMLVAIFGLGLANVIVAIALAYIDDFARVIRGMVLMLKEEDFGRIAGSCSSTSSPMRCRL
ncbi:MAG: ABC transporter permease, partial [Dehalococcoidia bacterium]|nr:ABC transporter permease [Dehalococcoidia bacterium]